MQVQITNLAAEQVGSLELADAVFGVEVRADILHRVVLWQLAKRRGGHAQGQDPGRDRRAPAPSCTSRRVPAGRGTARGASTCSVAAA